MPISQTCCHIGKELEQCGMMRPTELRNQLLIAAYWQRH